MTLTRQSSNARTGFTLVEVLIVVVLMAIMATVAMTQVNNSVTDAQVATAQEIVATVQRRIRAAQVLDTSTPGELDIQWFTPPRLPSNPFQLDMPLSRSYIDASNDPSLMHPADKTTESGSPYWYNPQNGVFRMRVPWQGNASDTLDLYNRCNGTRSTDVADTTSL
jgi:prepilin-type N-terminal cleavage/methylation domain-containing protein